MKSLFEKLSKIFKHEHDWKLRPYLLDGKQVHLCNCGEIKLSNL